MGGLIKLVYIFKSGGSPLGQNVTKVEPLKMEKVARFV